MSFGITVPYVPTPIEVVREMLKLAGLKPGEIILDLGSGDGRVLITAAKEFGAKAIGVELRKDLIEKAITNIEREGVKDRVMIIQGNFFDIKLPPANVIFLYLLTSVNERLRPKLEKETKPGTRIVSHDFEIAGWKPYKVKEVRDGGRTHRIILYMR